MIDHKSRITEKQKTACLFIVMALIFLIGGVLDAITK